MVNWLICAAMDEIDIERRYAGHPTIFSILLFHGGEFTLFPGRTYINGRRTYVEYLLDIDTFSVHELDAIMLEMGYAEEGIRMFYNFRRPLSDLNFGLFALGSDNDIRHLGSFVAKHKLIEEYIEHGRTCLHTYGMSPNLSNVRIQEVIERPTCSRRLFLGWKEDNLVEDNGKNMAAMEDNSEGVDCNEGKDVEGNDNSEDSDSDDSLKTIWWRTWMLT